MSKKARNSIIYMIGMFVIATLSFLSTMIVTRILPSRVYAQYGLLITFTTAAVTVISLGMDAAYTRFFYSNNNTVFGFLLNCFKIPFVIFIIFTILVIEPSHFLLKFIFEEEITNIYILVFVAYLFFLLIHKFTQATARMGELALNYISSNIVAKVGFLFVLLTVNFLTSKVTFIWVTLAFAIASAAAVLINIVSFKKIKAFDGKEKSVISSKEMLLYGSPFMMNNLFALIIPLIEKFIIRNLAGWELLGIYTAASVFYTVIALMQNTLDNVWNPIVYQYFSRKEIFKPLLHDFGLIISAIMTFGLATCILLRRWLVLILDISYFQVYIIAPTIMYTACFAIITMIYAIGINTSKKTIHLIITPLIQIVISLTLCYSLIPQLGLVGIAIASLFSIFFSRLYRILMGLKFYDTGRSEWKSYILWGGCITASVVSLFSLTLFSDILVFSLLTIFTVALINKEINHLINQVVSIFWKKKSLV